MKPFLTNKGCLENNDIIVLDGEEMITNDKILAKCFTPFLYKLSIFDIRPENYLSFSKKSPPKIV